jgi:hypothetical protein
MLLYCGGFVDLGQNRTVAELISRLWAAKGSEGAVKVEGTWGLFAHLLTAFVSERIERPILYVCPHIDDCDKTVDDLQAFGAKGIEPLGAWEAGKEAVKTR